MTGSHFFPVVLGQSHTDVTGNPAQWQVTNCPGVTASLPELLSILRKSDKKEDGVSKKEESSSSFICHFQVPH